MKKKGNKKDHKSTKAVKEQRINTVISLIVKGLRREQIIRYISEKTKWDVTSRTIDKYIAEANKYFEERSEIKRREYLGKNLSRLEHIFFKAMEDGDYRDSVGAIKEINELIGIKKLLVEHSGEIKTKDNSKEVKEILNEFRDIFGKSGKETSNEQKSKE